ncbi:MAG: hypothetical protein RH917_08460 [Lacipirellulaceae bacterium]
MPDFHESKSDQPDERLEAYLDDCMTPEERQAFESEMAGNEQLRQQYDLQQQLDASLGRLFVAPAAPPDILSLADREGPTKALNELPDRDQEADKETSKKNRRAIFALLAAIIAWIIVGVGIDFDNPKSPYDRLALAEIYEKSVADGFQPKWVCDDDREFAETFQQRQGVPLLLKPDAQDLMVGLSYLSGVTSRTTTMLARVDGKPVLVFVERLALDTKPEAPSWSSGLELFRKELGDLVLYEVTPFSEPRVLEHFYIPETLPPLEESEASVGEE